jgi:hypothetical protein
VRERERERKCEENFTYYEINGNSTTLHLSDSQKNGNIFMKIFNPYEKSIIMER